MGLASMEQGKRARQWGAYITLIASPVTPVVGNCFLVPHAPWTPSHLSARQVDHPALAQAGVWRRLSCGLFLSGPGLLERPRPLGIATGPWRGKHRAREEPFAGDWERLSLWPWALEAPSCGEYQSLPAAWVPCLLLAWTWG